LTGVSRCFKEPGNRDEGHWYRRHQAEHALKDNDPGPGDDTGEQSGRAPIPAGSPERACVADITYLRTGEGWLHLAAVQDAYSRPIVAWSIATHMPATLVVDALQMALARRRPEPGLIHHFDQGSQGGFKRSSQHSSERSCDGQAEGVGV
jgi:transposase InsO family protein